MGILFNTNTWRSPLQLIDCWLPAPALRKTPAANGSLGTRAVVQRFARAGWLGRRAPAQAPQERLTMPSPTNPSCRVRVLRQTGRAVAKQGSVRLVISGRINDVCAELDRLADQEHQLASRAA
jgi:hypothetical protein